MRFWWKITGKGKKKRKEYIARAKKWLEIARESNDPGTTGHALDEMMGEMLNAINDGLGIIWVEDIGSSREEWRKLCNKSVLPPGLFSKK